MAKARGGDDLHRKKHGSKGLEKRPRQVYVFTEGEVTEPEYIDIIVEYGLRARAGQSVQVHHENPSDATKDRKPLPLVEKAVRTLRTKEREAATMGLDKKTAWNWPQVWVLFDRDDHPAITRAVNFAQEKGVRVAYSHPCFELWRLLHYQNYTSTFGGVCDDANDRLRRQPGFAQTYGKNVQRVSRTQSKHVKAGQVLRDGDRNRYAEAKKYAQKINEGHPSDNPNHWDPYTDVWHFVEDGLLLSGY